MIYYIYKIYSEDCDYVYVGSTRAYARRKNEHKARCNNENDKAYNRKLYQTIRDNGGWSNWKMVCIDEIDVENRRQAEMKEEEARQKLQANLNMVKSYQTEEQMKEYNKEYRDKHKEKAVEYKKKWYDENRNKILEQQKEQIKCECGSEIRRSDLARHKKSKKHQAWEWRQTALSTKENNE